MHFRLPGTIFLLLALFATPAAGARAAKAIPSDLVTPGELWYGLYMHGGKVGWMHLTTSVTDQAVSFSTVMQARVRGMNRIANLTMKETRTYDPGTQRLKSLLYSQNSPGVSMETSARRNGDSLEGTITTGGRAQTLSVPTHETLADHMASELLVLGADTKIGLSHTATHYEPSMMLDMTVKVSIDRVESTIIDGVPSKIFHLSSHTVKPAGTGISSTSVLDQQGTLLRTEIGGFFTAKLESPTQAQDLSATKDILVSSVVKLPPGVSASLLNNDHRVTFTGFPPDFSLPQADYQRGQRQGDKVVLTIRRPRGLEAPVNLPIIPGPTQAAFLRSEPQYQSDAPLIRNTARSIVGSGRDAWQAVTALVDWIDASMRKTYVPAMANALDVLRTLRGDCTEHSTLFVALARALGIPARQVVGIAYWPDGGGYGWHAWAEVWLGRWLPVDPTWDQDLADTTHIKLAAGSIADQARIAGLLGTIRVTAVEPLQ